ncbi:MAG: hypothetical protein H7296_05140 [Bacteroidia bacterium]|nr:hypothetical protein [Bacteroidia bacterium]
MNTCKALKIVFIITCFILSFKVHAQFIAGKKLLGLNCSLNNNMNKGRDPFSNSDKHYAIQYSSTNNYINISTSLEKLKTDHNISGKSVGSFNFQKTTKIYTLIPYTAIEGATPTIFKH